MENTTKPSKAARITGWVISILTILFLLMDAGMKIAMTAPSVQGSGQLGWPVSDIQPIGIVLLICTIIYIIPATAVLGAILLTGYLGGAVSIMARTQMPGHPFIFPVIFGILVWAGLYFRDVRLRTLIPFRQA